MTKVNMDEIVQTAITLELAQTAYVQTVVVSCALLPLHSLLDLIINASLLIDMSKVRENFDMSEEEFTLIDNLINSAKAFISEEDNREDSSPLAQTSILQ